WGQADRHGRMERNVVWQTARSRDEFVFTGGLVMICNRSLDDVPELRAVKTRIAVVHSSPTNAEIAALMRDIARQRHRHGPHELTPAECLDVAGEHRPDTAAGAAPRPAAAHPHVQRQAPVDERRVRPALARPAGGPPEGAGGDAAGADGRAGGAEAAG